MMYNEKFEAISKEDLEQLQIERLQIALNRVCRNVAFYKQKFDECNINIEDIKSIDDIKKLPFTTKDDLRNSYPYDMFAVPLRDIVRIHSSLGTTGKSIVVGYTKNDINNWSELVARLLTAAGITEQDFVQIAFDYSLFTGGLGLHYGAEKIGASVIPSSLGTNIQKQIFVMKDYKTSALLSTPSHAINIANNLSDMGIHPEELNLRLGLFGAEPWTEKLRNQIEEKLHITAYDNYGINKIMGPGVSGECERKNGLHINEDHYLVEIIDKKSLEPLKFGEEGELVITTLTREGFPLIRYRTGDLAFLMDGKCQCGRTTLRMSRVMGRTDDMVVVRGINIFPAQIEEILTKVEGIKPRYQAIIENEDGIDSLEIQIEISEDIFDDEMKKLMELKNKISRLVEDELNVPAKATLVEKKTLDSGSGEKLNRVIDKR